MLRFFEDTLIPMNFTELSSLADSIDKQTNLLQLISSKCSFFYILHVASSFILH